MRTAGVTIGVRQRPGAQHSFLIVVRWEWRCLPCRIVLRIKDKATSTRLL